MEGGRARRGCILQDEDILSALYDGVTRDDALPAMLGLLARRFRCPAAALMSGDPLYPAADIAIGHGLIDEDAQARYRETYAALDPAPAAMARLPVGQAGATGRMLATDAAAHRRFLDEFYVPLGLREALGGPFERENGRFGLIAVQRGPDRGPFDDEDIAAFEGLMPHIRRVVVLRRSFFRLEQQVDILQNAIEPISIGIAVLDERGRVVGGNMAARRMLARRDGLEVGRDGRLIVDDRNAARDLARILVEVGSSVAPLSMSAPRRAGHPYVLRFTRAEGSSGRAFAIRPHAVALVRDPETRATHLPALFQAVYDLTPAEGRLAGALAEGSDLQGYADRTGITRETAKFHLKRIFSATDTNRQVDLVRLLSSLAREIGAAPEPDPRGQVGPSAPSATAGPD